MKFEIGDYVIVKPSYSLSEWHFVRGIVVQTLSLPSEGSTTMKIRGYRPSHWKKDVMTSLDDDFEKYDPLCPDYLR